ncbi:MAG TPA: haloacid dehalogenase-like hydrolase [Myxococcota bacterium]
MSSKVVSDAVARAVAQAAKNVDGRGRAPVAVFDLDGTLFDNGPRTWQILVDFAEHEGNAELRRALDAARRTGLPYLLQETLATLNVVDAAVTERAHKFWLDRFFTDAHQAHDLPIAGALALVRALYEQGTTIVYLSGRDVPNMLIGVCESLRTHGFPVGLARTAVVLKPSFHDEDLAFKKSALSFIDSMGEVVASYDNEPANCNAFAERWPNALHVFVATQHAPNPPPLHSDVITVDDLT